MEIPKKNKGGRPPETNWNKKLADYFTPEQKAEFLADVFERAKKDSRLAAWLGDHLFGKAPQPIQGSGDNGEIIIKVVSYADNNTSV